MSRYPDIHVQYIVSDPLTPIHIVLNEDQAWLTVEEAQEIRDRLKKAIRHAKALRGGQKNGE